MTGSGLHSLERANLLFEYFLQNDLILEFSILPIGSINLFWVNYFVLIMPVHLSLLRFQASFAVGISMNLCLLWNYWGVLKWKFSHHFFRFVWKFYQVTVKHKSATLEFPCVTSYGIQLFLLPVAGSYAYTHRALETTFSSYGRLTVRYLRYFTKQGKVSFLPFSFIHMGN